MRRWAGRSRAKRLVANAMVEADPVDPLVPATGVAITQLHAPGRRPRLADVAKRTLHRLALHDHALGFPAAGQADVQQFGIAERRALGPSASRNATQDKGCRSSRGPLHGRGECQTPSRFATLERCLQPARTSQAPTKTSRTPAMRVRVAGWRARPSRP